MDIRPFQERRARLMAAMGQGIALIPTAPERLRNRDSHYPYRFDSYFWYLAGFAEPESVLVLLAGPEPKSLLFCREKNLDKEIWDGFRWGPEAAREAYGFDEAHPVSELEAKLAELMADRPTLFYSLGHDPDWDWRVIDALNAVRGKARTGVRPPESIRDVRQMLDEMRLIKDGAEMDLLTRSADVSSYAHRRAMQATRPGRFEYEIEAEFLHEFRLQGAHAPAYGSIVAGGANACTLHYVANDRRLQDGDLLLIDAGCEMHGYAADITRTFPVNGRFNPAQRDAYQIVLAAQSAAIEAVRPGRSWDEPHQAALRVLTQGMVDLKLLQGTVDGLIESEAYKRFYMHRTGHWLGLDVHDAGDYKIHGEWRLFEPGMVLTVEPGLYIRAADDVPEALCNIGIRIEDNLVVTPSGCAVLTTAPRTVAEIEAAMAENRA
ncbi:MAG: aminopeptidase P N-terminal domain-containing protein [Rhodocyclaceae bacterium]|nr:aminopeptidase P N-terminal domain-containing protein [Rhodocyclaceae bacterium]